MMGQIVAVANQKGGVGKTTLAVHLAVGAARAGKRVVLVDADPQGNATSWLLDGEEDHGLFELLVTGASPARVLRGLSRWGLALLPGSYRTGEAFAMLGAVGRLGEVAPGIRRLAEVAQVTIVDMPPSRAAGFTECLSAADWVIVPTQLERLALEGVGLMAQVAMELQEQGGPADGPRLMGIVPNMTRVQTREHQTQMGELLEAFGPTVWPPLPLTIRVPEAAAYGSTLYERSPDLEVTGTMCEICSRMLGVLNGSR
jgi:chromosome partitioning protein